MHFFIYKSHIEKEELVNFFSPGYKKCYIVHMEPNDIYEYKHTYVCI